MHQHQHVEEWDYVVKHILEVTDRQYFILRIECVHTEDFWGLLRHQRIVVTLVEKETDSCGIRIVKK